VDAQSAGLRHGIDQAVEGRYGRQGKIVALGQPLSRNAVARKPVQALHQIRRSKPRAVDDGPAIEFHRRVAANSQQNPAFENLSTQDTSVEGDHRATVLRLAEIGQHQAMAVDDTGRRGQQRRRRAERGFPACHFSRVQPLQVFDAIAGGGFRDPRQFRFFRLARRHDQFAAAAMLDAMFGAVAIEHVAAGHAQQGLQAVLRVVDSGMDDLAVARTGMGADLALFLEEDNLAPCQRQLPRNGEPHYARAHDNAVRLFPLHCPQSLRIRKVAGIAPAGMLECGPTRKGPPAGLAQT
jgi:hypothetical protein